MIPLGQLISQLKNWPFETLGKYKLTEEDAATLIMEYDGQKPIPRKKVTIPVPGIEKVIRYECPRCNREVQIDWTYCPQCRQKMCRSKEESDDKT